MIINNYFCFRFINGININKQNFMFISNKNISNNKYSHFLLLSGIIVLTIIVYSGTFKNGFTNWDDDAQVVYNSNIRSLSTDNILKIFSSKYVDMYQPIPTLTYTLEYKFSGMNPITYHTTNLLFHLLNIILVFFLLFRITKQPDISLLVTTLFAIHPMNAETISWISCRSNLLYTCFYLGSLIYYLKYQDTRHKTQEIRYKIQDTSIKTIDQKKSKVKSQQSTVNAQHAVFYSVSLLLFILSLLSKSMAVTLPVILILSDYYYDRKINSKSIIDKIPFLLIGLAYGIITIVTQKHTESASDIMLQYSLINRFFVITYSISFYLTYFIAPIKLSALHPSPEMIQGLLPLKYYLSPILILLIAVVIYKSKKNKKEIIFGGMFFLFTISITLTAGNLRWAEVAERYTYIPYLGLFFILATLFKSKSKKQKAKTLIFTFIILIFSVFTFNRNKVWSDSLSLFNDVIEKYPNSFKAYNNRGKAKEDTGDKEGAINDYTKAIDCNNKFEQAYENRGNLKSAMGNKNGAIMDYDKIISLNPKNADAYYNRGLAEFALNDYNKVMEDFNKAIEIDPGYANAFVNRGFLNYKLGKNNEAMQDYNKAIEINSQIAQAFINRGYLKYSLGDHNGGCTDWAIAGRLGEIKGYDLIRQYCQ